MKAIARLLAAFLVVAAARAAWAEVPSAPYAWKNVTVGGGGFAPDIIFSPAEKGLAYLRTDMGGAYRWDAGAQRWIPLEDGFAQGSYMGVESLAADPKDPNVVYVAGGMYDRDPAAILRSGDRGATWTVTPVPFRMGANEDGRGMGERLAIDPNRTSTLLFGSRHDGLWRSDDSGRIWSKIESFPWQGLGPPLPRHTHGGISFVVFDPNSRAVFAGVADPAADHLFRSDDEGRTWTAVAGGPPAELVPVKAAMHSGGILYVDYCNGIGPNGITAGAVWKLDTRSGRWTDITPDRGSEGGYMGLALDRTHPGRIAVSTVDRWHPWDTVWLSDNGGRSWSSLRERSRLDVSATPFLKFDKPEADFGHWMSGLAFDPFDGGTLVYTTGATVMRTGHSAAASPLWAPWVKGIEQTAVTTLASPTAGAPLISGFGDIAGFVHDGLDVSPPRLFLNPFLPNTNTLDYAGLAPNVVVRSGSRHKIVTNGISLAWSNDGGHDWTPLAAPAVAVDNQPAARFDTDGEAAITVSADGRTFVVSGPVMLATSDRGTSWWRPAGLPVATRAVADKVDRSTWYAVDYTGSRIFVSRDGARSFVQAGRGLPTVWPQEGRRWRETPSALLARPGHAGELWMLVGERLYRSTDFARTFSVASTPDMTIRLFGLGKAAPGASTPALYVFGTKDGLSALWQSTDGGVRWSRINDDAHQWGLRFRAITGDPKLFGRVYLATDGRGILYGDPLR